MAETRSPSLPRLALLELRRLLGRRSFQVFLLLSLLPLLAAVAMRGTVQEAIRLGVLEPGEARRLWLVFLGSTAAAPAVEGLMGLLGVSALSVTSLSWLIAAVLAAGSMAGDISSGRLHMLAVRPVTRARLLAAKTLGLAAGLAALYLAADTVAYIAAWIMAGAQEKPWIIPLHTLATVLALLPLALLALILGLRARSMGAILGTIVAYIAAGMVDSLPLIVALARSGGSVEQLVGATASAAKLSLLLSAADPLTPHLPGYLVDALVAGGKHAVVQGFTVADPAVMPTYTELAALAAAAAAAGAAALGLLAAKVFERQVLRA